MEEKVANQKSYAFALRIIKLYSFLRDDQKEYVLSKQVLRSGTVIGTLIHEAERRPNFIHKLAIANKEASETHYWLSLLRDHKLLEDRLANSFLMDCEEIKSFSLLVSKPPK